MPTPDETSDIAREVMSGAVPPSESEATPAMVAGSRVGTLHRLGTHAPGGQRDSATGIRDDVAGHDEGEDLQLVLQEVESLARRWQRYAEWPVLRHEPGVPEATSRRPWLAWSMCSPHARTQRGGG